MELFVHVILQIYGHLSVSSSIHVSKLEETRTEKAYGKGKFFCAIKWLPLIPGSSSATERYSNFLQSHFLPLAQRPSNFNSGAHVAFPVASHSFFCESVWMSSSCHYRKQRHMRHK